ncbi:MAG: Lytic transglycosylase [Pseudomonadota bacterium]|nr:Lytic transglycosylase [Pseudomonadota bacterium]
MKRRLLAGLMFILIPVLLALSSPVHADIYAFVDKNGVRHLSNVPNDPRYKLVMRTPAYSKQAAIPSSYAPINLHGGVTITPRNYAQRAAGIKPRRVNEQNRQRFAADVNRIAAYHRLEPALLHAVISAESSYNPWAVSPKGAMGLMQLMPGTAERFGVSNPYDPVANMNGGARYLRWLLDRFNDTRLAVAAYNAGEGAVQKYGNQIPPYQETQTYVVRVLDFYQRYRMGPYNTGAVAMNAGSGVNRGAGGITIITPRTSGRNAVTQVTNSGRPGATPAPRTYLTPTGDRVIVGNSSGNRSTVRSLTNTPSFGNR